MTIAFSAGANLPIYELYPVYTQSVPGMNQDLFKNFEPDKFEPTTMPETKETEPPKIGMARVIFHRLTKEQLAEVNETRQLPKNAKIVNNEVSGEPRMTWNLLDWSLGTHTLPKGYEMKNDILGFTHIVREDSKAWWLKK